MTPEAETLEDQERVRAQARRLHWLIGLRWIALTGIALAGTVTQFVGYASFELDKGWLLAPPVLAYNVLFLLWLRRTEHIGAGSKTAPGPGAPGAHPALAGLSPGGV